MRKTQKVLSKKAFFRFINAWGFQSFSVTSPSMRKKLRPDVASDTSRRNNNCVTTQHQIRRDENEGTNSHHNNIWQFPALFRELPYVLSRCVSTICIYNMAIWQLKQRIQTFLFFLHQSNQHEKAHTDA